MDQENQPEESKSQEKNNTVDLKAHAKGLSNPQTLAMLIVLALLLGLGLWRINKVNAPEPLPSGQEVVMPSSSQVSETPVISYEGVEGQTALEILKATHEVSLQSFGDLGDFVQSIDGLAGDKDHFWAFYVNGKQSAVGASDYSTKAGDQIEWKFERIN